MSDKTSERASGKVSEKKSEKVPETVARIDLSQVTTPQPTKSPQLYSPSKRKSELQYLEPKTFESSGVHLPQMVRQHSSKDIDKVIAETKEREQRVLRQVELLREQARLALEDCNGDDRDRAKSPVACKALTDKLSNCEQQLSDFKSTMDRLLNVAKETHHDVQKTKDIASSIQNDYNQSRLTGSFQSRFLDDYGEEMFNEGNVLKYSDIERPGAPAQQTPMITTNDDDCISICKSIA